MAIMNNQQNLNNQSPINVTVKLENDENVKNIQNNLFHFHRQTSQQRYQQYLSPFSLL